MRVATLFGVGGMSRTGTNFVETVLRKAAEGYEFPVVDDQTMSPTSAEDVAEFVLTVLRRGCDRGVYHVVNTGEVTRYGFAREILRQAGMPVGIVRHCTSEEFPTAAKRPSYSALENQKLRSVVGRRNAKLAGRARCLSQGQEGALTGRSRSPGPPTPSCQSFGGPSLAIARRTHFRRRVPADGLKRRALSTP